MFLLGVPWPGAEVDEAALAACADSLLGTRSTCKESMDLSGRVGAFQCKLRSGNRAAKSSCINGKTPEGSWYSTVKYEYRGVEVAGVHTRHFRAR